VPALVRERQDQIRIRDLDGLYRLDDGQPKGGRTGMNNRIAKTTISK
jgi:hypothetical protein